MEDTDLAHIRHIPVTASDPGTRPESPVQFRTPVEGGPERRDHGGAAALPLARRVPLGGGTGWHTVSRWPTSPPDGDPRPLRRGARQLRARSGRGIRKGDVVRITVGEEAKPMYVALRNAVLRPGGTYLGNYLPNGVAREGVELASNEQLSTFHRAVPPRAGRHDRPSRLDPLDESTCTSSKASTRRSCMLARRTSQPYRGVARTGRRSRARYTWTLGLYGTTAMAKEARMSLEGVLAADHRRLLSRRSRADQALARDDPGAGPRQAPARPARDRAAPRGGRRRRPLDPARPRPTVARRPGPEHPELRDLQLTRLARHRGNRPVHRAALPLRKPDRGRPRCASSRARSSRRVPAGTRSCCSR